MDDGDVAKFTDAIKDFDGMTRLVCCLLLSTLLSSLVFFLVSFSVSTVFCKSCALHAYKAKHRYAIHLTHTTNLCHGKVRSHLYYIIWVVFLPSSFVRRYVAVVRPLAPLRRDR